MATVIVDPDFAKAVESRQAAARRKRLEKAARARQHFKQIREAKAERHRAATKKTIYISYGMLPSDYSKLFQKQNGRCAICASEFGHWLPVNVDHCHSTGKVRGLLCPRCNKGIGHFLDDPKLLASAASYIELPPAREFSFGRTDRKRDRAFRASLERRENIKGKSCRQ